MLTISKTFAMLSGVIVASTFLLRPAFAQDGAFDMGGLTATLSTDHVTQAERARSINDQIFNPSASPVQATAADFTYRYDRARTEQNLRNFVARTPDPVGRSELEKFLSGQPTLIEDIRVGIRSYGYDSHNVADAYAMWMMMSWLAAEGRLEDPDREMAQNVAAQVRSSFAATPDFAKTTDAERQEYAEALLVQSIILAELLKATQGNPEQSSQLSSMARKGAQESGLDLSKIALTRKGFVPRKGADASGAVAGEDPIRNARADAPAGESESSSIGLALAAGVGLGVTLLGGLALMRRG